MRKNIIGIWKNFISQPDIWFFYAFLITFTLSIRKILYFVPINNSFNEYTGVYIYLSDIFLFLTFISYILCNNIILLSNISFPFPTQQNKSKIVPRLSRKMFHACPPTGRVEHFYWDGTISLSKKAYAYIIKNYIWIFPLSIALFSFISILWSINETIALYRSIKLLEFVFLYFYIIKIVPRLPAKSEGGTIQENTSGTQSKHLKMFHVEHFQIQTNNAISNCSTWNNLRKASSVIITIGLIQALIGIAQIILQHSIGLFWLKESLLFPEIPGVAKIILNGNTHIRAYGLFPHPNIFGGFLVFSIITTLTYFKLFHACPVKCSTWNISTGMEQFDNKETCNEKHTLWKKMLPEYFKIVPRGTILSKTIITIQAIALFLTFSKSAIIGLFVGLLYIKYQSRIGIAPRLSANWEDGTILKHKNNQQSNINYQALKQLFHVEQFKGKFVLILGILILLIAIIKPDMQSLFTKSLQERNFYLNVSRGTIAVHPFIGIGAGQEIINMAKTYDLESWQYQPVHNVFLNIATEYGVFVLAAFACFLLLLFRKTNCSTWNNLEENAEYVMCLKGILIAFVFIMLFDHYFWDIQQGSLLLWMLLALIACRNKNCNKQKGA
ncbi:MAG: O-antigen ligase family protein [Candidatus Moranbacteria bacterium]|nr:O-antigen ligase family protein [Candidatus Moranbacteria bacterium]